MGIRRVTATAALAVFAAAAGLAVPLATACGQPIVDDAPGDVVPDAGEGGLGDAAAPNEGGASPPDGAAVGPDGGPATCGRRDGGGWLVFVTEGTYRGDYAKGAGNGGVKIDELCTSLALDAGFAGAFKAYVASPPEQAHERVTAAGPGWDRPDGVRAFAANDSLVLSPEAELEVTEKCTLVTDSAGVWTGVSPDAVVAQSCGDWNMTASNGHYGDPRSRTSTWRAQTFGACSVSRHFYCFQVSN